MVLFGNLFITKYFIIRVHKLDLSCVHNVCAYKACVFPVFSWNMRGWASWIIFGCLTFWSKPYHLLWLHSFCILSNKDSWLAVEALVTTRCRMVELWLECLLYGDWFRAVCKKLQKAWPVVHLHKAYPCQVTQVTPTNEADFCSTTKDRLWRGCMERWFVLQCPLLLLALNGFAGANS